MRLEWWKNVLVMEECPVDERTTSYCSHDEGRTVVLLFSQLWKEWTTVEVPSVEQSSELGEDRDNLM